MRPLTYLIIFATLQCALTKNTVKTLTESLGQEVIELGVPIKDLPSDLEEEPSAENDEEDQSTTTTLQAGTKRDTKRPSTSLPVVTVETRRKNSPTALEQVDDEEMRIEKELAEIYKDNSDYKGDSSEVAKTPTTTAQAPEKSPLNKPVARSRANFKFQPDVHNRAEVEKFRTSVDKISCEKARNKLNSIHLRIIGAQCGQGQMRNAQVLNRRVLNVDYVNNSDNNS